jgi:hypothetical protein
MYEKTIYENEEKGYQYRLTYSTFRDVEYLHLRKYFLTYDGDYHPSKEGASIPATIQNTYNILDGLLDVLSKSEGWDSIKQHISSRIKD